MGSIRHEGRKSPRVSLESVAPDVIAAIAAAQAGQPRRRRRARVVLPSVSLLLVAALVVVGVAMLGAIRPSHLAVAAATQTPPHQAASTATPISPAPAPSATPTAARQADPELLSGYTWPLPNGRVTLPFGPTDWGEFFSEGVRVHDGVDMASFCGDVVHAAHSGVVLAASREFDQFLGWRGSLSPYWDYLDRKHAWISLPITVVIDDQNGYRSIYAHFDSVTVAPGDVVSAGDVIGYEGATGNASGCHVHYGLFSPLDPSSFALDPTLAQHMQLPALETARINPLVVLPYRPDVEEMRPFRTPPPSAAPVRTGP